jgi:hypothetical protein
MMQQQLTFCLIQRALLSTFWHGEAQYTGGVFVDRLGLTTAYCPPQGADPPPLHCKKSRRTFRCLFAAKSK